MAERDSFSTNVEADTVEFDPSKKKKRKKKNFQVSSGVGSAFDVLRGKQTNHVNPFVYDEENLHLAEDFDVVEEEEERIVSMQYSSVENDQDYEYLELLNRMFSILHENNPDVAVNKHRTVMKPIEVQGGTKMTVFANFMDICKMMRRKPQQVMNFFLAEMGTSGSLDRRQQLVVNGRFASKIFEEAQHNYINKYVLCHDCNSPDTIIAEENHLFLLGCQQCGTKRIVDGSV